MTTAAELKEQYRRGEIDEVELDRRLERLAEREGVDALTLTDPAAQSAGPQLVEQGLTRWFAAALAFVTVAVALPWSESSRTLLGVGAGLCVAAGIVSFAVYSYRRGSLPRTAAP